MRANVQFLICDAEEVFVSRVTGAVPSRDLARAWYTALLEHPRRAVYPEIADLRRYSGTLNEADWAPVRALRSQLCDQLGFGADYVNLRAVLTTPDAEGTMMFEMLRHRHIFTNVFNVTTPELAWARAAPGVPMPAAVYQFLRVTNVALTEQATNSPTANVIPFAPRRSGAN